MLFVEARDQGICTICQRDTVAAENEFQSWMNENIAIAYSWKRPDETDVQYAARKASLDARKHSLGFARGRWREVDHIVPVCEGGGLCGPDGLRLLCGVCHELATTKLAGRRKAS
jgi:hypothetical protein